MAIEGFADNETEHAILAGSILALLAGAVGYASVHNIRHRKDEIIGDFRYHYLLDRVNEVDDDLGALVGYNPTFREKAIWDRNMAQLEPGASPWR